MIIPDLKAANGVTSYAMNYYKKLDHEKICMDFAIYSDELLVEAYKREIESVGGRIFVLPSFFSFNHYSTCKKIIKEGNYDIIHDNSLHITLPLMMAAKSAKIPVRVLHSHSSKLGETLLKKIRNRAFLPLLRCLVTDYAACSEIAGRALFGNKSFIVIPNVINGEKYRFSVERRNYVRMKMNSTTKFVIISVGRLATEKNPFFAMDVIKESIKLDKNIEYWWVGDGPLYEQVQKYAEKIGINEHVRFLGSRTDVNDLYQAADCFLLPSLFEGFSLVTVEAQTAGLPCVISEAIPQEVIFRNEVKRVSLEMNEKIWAQCICKNVKGFDRSDGYDFNPYLDINAGRFMQDYYSNRCKRNEE